MRELLWVNGRILSPHEPAISGRDAGFLFAEGCYETLRVYGGRCYLWPEHIRRLMRGLQALHIPHRDMPARLERAARALIRAARAREAALRIVVSRGPAWPEAPRTGRSSP